MIIVKLIGGLGNQLFQYAAGRRLAELHGVPLKLDLRGFETYRLHKYSLHAFRIREELATPEEIRRLDWRGQRTPGGLWLRAVQALRPYCRRTLFLEEHLGPYDPNILKTPRDVYLGGYWQSEKYFRDIADIIRREFTVREDLAAESARVAAEIRGAESVAVHVRRGDYVWNPETTKYHGLSGPEYYRRGVEEIARRVGGKLHLFFFSDDPDWVAANLLFDWPSTYVRHNDASRNYDDLRLMSLCRHDVIANSSFSWWAAWLNANPGKIVCAPKQWINNPEIDTRDILPDTWISL